MTVDEQLPFDGPSNDRQDEPVLGAVQPSAESDDDGSTAADRSDLIDESGDGTAPGSVEPTDEEIDQPSAPDEHDFAAHESESGTGLVRSAESSPTEALSISEPAAAPRALYFLTNRMNLNGILSSRLVAPRESFQKYYTDLLQRTPGWVPLLRNAPTSAQLDAVTIERGAGSPVLIEFPLDVLGKMKLDAAIEYVPAIALSEALAIHLPSERDLREHRARGYSNVHPHDELLRVTPELFQSDASDQVTMEAPTSAPAVDWRKVDRVRGAVNAAFASASSGEQLVLAAAFIGATKLPAAVNVPEWFGWVDLDDHADHAARPVPDTSRPDHVGFRAAYDVLGDRDASQAWSPNEVLDSVESRVREAGLADDAADALVRNLDRVRSIVNVEAEFERFRPTTRALISAKALLLALLRPELDQLLAWPDDETGADDATRVVAAVLAGRLRGLARESTEQRSLALDDLTAAWAARVARGGSASLGKPQLVANSRSTSLKIDGVEVASQGALLPDLVSKYQKTADTKQEALRLKVARAMGWPVDYLVQLPPGATVETGDALITIATPSELVLEVSVDEIGFIRRLESLTASDRRRAAEAFAARR